MGDRGFPPFHVSRVSPSTMMRVCLFCNPLCVCNLGMIFSLRGEGCNTPVLNLCNIALILLVITS
jgi:hypothetical protein